MNKPMLIIAILAVVVLLLMGINEFLRSLSEEDGENQ